ncbi:uncharacterized protein BROUX77_001508 [Berkeleyomyces rouxiae]|uniref:uncharacterized protein n=1 Tax=Berkeleyomyces rouxiae TaxID=2035830 RepID=UPI003B807D65
MSSDFRRQRPRRSATKSAADQVHEVDDDDNDRGAGHEVDSDSDVYQISDHEDSDTESFCEEEAGPKTPAARRRIASTKSTTTPIRTPRAKATSSPTKASAVKRKLKSNTTPASARPRKAASSNDVTCDDMTAQSPINNSNPNIIEPYPSQLTNRSYHGPLRLRRRIGFVLERFYGPIPADIKTAAGFINHWYSYDELPIINQRPEPAWLPADFQDQQLQLLHNWKSSGAYITQTETLDCGSGALSENTSLLKELIVISERNETRMQRLQVQLVPRLSPEHGDGGEASFQRPGWLLNLSGTVLNMTWAPKEVNDRQTLVQMKIYNLHL